jgi:hypothetical protein
LTILNSSYSSEELIARWDDRLNPARFAGNDDVLDLVFYGKRKGNKVKLMRRSGVSREPLSAIFRGRIVGTAQGSELRGFFTKSVIEYIIISVLLAFVYFIYREVKHRFTDISWINIILAAVFILAILSLLRTGKSTKAKYIDFLKDIL